MVYRWSRSAIKLVRPTTTPSTHGATPRTRSRSSTSRRWERDSRRRMVLVMIGRRWSSHPSSVRNGGLGHGETVVRPGRATRRWSRGWHPAPASSSTTTASTPPGVTTTRMVGWGAAGGTGAGGWRAGWGLVDPSIDKARPATTAIHTSLVEGSATPPEKFGLEVEKLFHLGRRIYRIVTFFTRRD